MKKLNNSIPYGHLKMEGLFLSKKNAIARRLNMQDKLKKRKFRSTMSQKVPEICDIPMERISIQISVLMFRSAFSSSNIYKINEKTLHQDSNSRRRYAFDGIHPKGAFNGLGYSNTLTAEFGFRNQHSKVSTEPKSTLEFLGIVVNSQDMTLSLPKKKTLKIQEHCKEVLNQTLTSVTTLIDRLACTVVAILPEPLQQTAFQRNQPQGMLSKNSLKEKVILSDQEKREIN